MLTALLALSAATNRATEVIKQALLARLNLSETNARRVTFIISLLIGEFAAFGANANLFADNPLYGQIPPTFGIFITGLLIGGGSNALQHTYDLLYGWKQTVTAPTVTATETSATTSPTGTTVKETVVSGPVPTALSTDSSRDGQPS